MTDFIDSQESRTSLPSLATHLPELMGRGMDFEDAFDHYLSVFVNGALDSDFLKPEYLKLMDHYESLIQPAVRKIEGAIQARVGVVFSSAWKADFRKALLSKPYMKLESMSSGSHGDCQACKLQDHPYSKKCTFTGQWYDPETLAEVNNEDDNSNEDDSSQERPMVIGDIPEVFKLGRFCAKRSSYHHQLNHYRYQILQKCKMKVNQVKECKLNKDDKDIFDQCMSNSQWKTKLREELEDLLKNADSYVDEKDHWK
ncbi:coiled-coil domain-containing protein 82-like [Liolophura sinensis]|uniref:coiled-coil domain-containing protein 82-like n=1 Tax=Liolophura sinensis TaxID=3198878 RepID=UPI003159931E